MWIGLDEFINYLMDTIGYNSILATIASTIILDMLEI